MPKLVVYKKDIRALEQAREVCRIMAAHSPNVPRYEGAQKAIQHVLDLVVGEQKHDDAEEK